MRSSDTPLPQHAAVNGRNAGYGIPPNHSYDTHTQAQAFVIRPIGSQGDQVIPFLLPGCCPVFAS
ncbi:RNA-binding (RRM/RBD/RNP motifs) family protein [Zea mays]|nr:RNA-binding (RRM/RBD/RNP motifs) family protein [Zea mays]